MLKKKFPTLKKLNNTQKVSISVLFFILLFTIAYQISFAYPQRILERNKENLLPAWQMSDKIYVNQNSSEKDPNGSPTKPFKKLETALATARNNKSIKKIFLFPSEFSYQKKELVIPKGISLYSLAGKTQIAKPNLSGQVLTLKGNNKINGLEISGGRYAIYIEQDFGQIEIRNSTLKNADWYGLYSEPDKSETPTSNLLIDNCLIEDNKKQGLYLQKSNFTITNSTIKNNLEEGIDLHIDMNSLIDNCQISNNGEGGIETEIGNINLEIKNSLIENNGSSGINLQSHSRNSEVTISNNKINSNADYGIRCALHSIIRGARYFLYGMLKIENTNTFKNNDLQNIDPNCYRY